MSSQAVVACPEIRLRWPDPLRDGMRRREQIVPVPADFRPTLPWYTALILADNSWEEPPLETAQLRVRRIRWRWTGRVDGGLRPIFEVDTLV